MTRKSVKLRCAVTGQSKPSRFEVVLLQEGLGNFGDCFYYTKGALESAVAIFEGKKGMYDHPNSIEEEIQPEGSVKRIAGHYENLEVVESKGRAELQGVFVVPAGVQFDYARGLLQHALEYAKSFPDKDFVGFSINASGDADEMDIDELLKEIPKACRPKVEQAKEMGITTVRVTQGITDAVSCDLVTEAGAGGKVLKMLEKAKETKKMGKKIVKEADDKGAVDAKDGDKGTDKELIKGMLDKHLGDGKHDEADHQAMEKALKAAKKAGYEGEEAEEAAAHHVQLSKHMAVEADEADEADEAEDEGDVPPPAKKKPPVADDGDGDDDSKEEESEDEKKEKKEGYEKEKKESQKKIVSLVAENSVLKERLGKHDLEKHIEKKLEESKLPRSATKLLRESAKDVKNPAEFDKFLKIFVESRSHALSGEVEGGFKDMFVNPEKIAAPGESGSGLSFADASQE